jgi:mono/diheme cytochrome c family protein
MKTFSTITLLLIFGVTAILTCAGPAAAQEGQKIFTSRCAACHGEDGKGDGPLAANFSPKPKDLALLQDVDKQVSDAVTKGKGQMVPIKLSPEQIKAVAAYIKSAFKG